MNITNYLFIGIIFSFLIDLIIEKFRNHYKIINLGWGWIERIFCVLLWPIGIIVVSIAFFKEYFKK